MPVRAILLLNRKAGLVMIDIETLRRGAARWKVELDETALSRFDAYAALLLE